MARTALCLALLFCLCSPAAADYDELTGGYMTVVDAKGQLILETGLAIHPGDLYISEDNRLYEINTVEGTLAKARLLYDMPKAFAGAGGITRAQAHAPPASDQAPAPAPPKRLIAIYYTHTDESYIPTDGQATIPGEGGILRVGAAFARRLGELGYAVENDETRHDPHDANAYQRSRRTFKRLLELGPDASFDIHRDSAPLNAYQVTIGGQPAAKMLLVVGRQNHNRQATMNYANQIKAAADAKYKGLIRGIFIAHGNYNQDMNPRVMLVELGTQYNSREAAERSAALFADVVPYFLAPAPSAPGTETPAEPADAGPAREASGGYGRDIVTTVGLLAAGIAGFLFISTGSWREAKRRLTRFRRFEFINFFCKKRKN
jgi:stage II sporulation protein P